MIVYNLDISHLSQKEKNEVRKLINDFAFSMVSTFDSNSRIESLVVHWSVKESFLDFVQTHCNAFVQEKHVSLASPTIMRN